MSYTLKRSLHFFLQYIQCLQCFSNERTFYNCFLMAYSPRELCPGAEDVRQQQREPAVVVKPVNVHRPLLPRAVSELGHAPV